MHVSNACPTCGLRNIGSGSGDYEPTPAKRARHERGLMHHALCWLREHPDQEVTRRGLAEALQRDGWVFNPTARTDPSVRVATVLGELLHLRLVRKPRPGVYVYSGEDA